MILHKFSSSPTGSQLIIQTMARLQTEDKIILLEDAVYACNDQALTSQLAKFSPVYCIADDLMARGLNINEQTFKAISYADFVELTLTCDQVISW